MSAPQISYYGSPREVWLEPISSNDTPQVIELKRRLEWATMEIENVRLSQSAAGDVCARKLELYRAGFWIAAAFIGLAGFLNSCV